LSTAAETWLFGANPRIVNLHLAAQRFPICVYPCSVQFVKQHPGRLVARKTELTLKEQRGHPALVRGHQIRRPEPMSQWNLRPVKHCPGRQRDLIATPGTLAPSLFNEFVRPAMPALRADETIWPSTSRQVPLTGLFAGELGLELP
jgi:hypothetical protein